MLGELVNIFLIGTDDFGFELRYHLYEKSSPKITSINLVLSLHFYVPNPLFTETNIQISCRLHSSQRLHYQLSLDRNSNERQILWDSRRNDLDFADEEHNYVGL
jgi:hypothetical protein